MRASGWVFLGLVVCAVPLAIGVATGQSWTPYVTYAGWAVILIAGIVRALLQKRRPRKNDSVAAGVSDVYNEMYMGRPHAELSFGNQADVVAEETVLRRDEIADGKVSLKLPGEKMTGSQS
jgi:hypothetical protein